MTSNETTKVLQELLEKDKRLAIIPVDHTAPIGANCVVCGKPIVVDINFETRAGNPDFIGGCLNGGKIIKPAVFTTHVSACYCKGCGIVYDPEAL